MSYAHGYMRQLHRALITLTAPKGAGAVVCYDFPHKVRYSLRGRCVVEGCPCSPSCQAVAAAPTYKQLLVSIW